MKPNKFFELIMYLGLLVIALWNVHKTIVEYTTGSKSYVKSNEPITQDDLPTITFIYEELKLAEHDNLNVTVLVSSDNLSNESISLVENRSIRTNHGFEMQLKKLKLSHHLGSRKCYTIIPKTYVDVVPTIDFSTFHLTFNIQLKNESSVSNSAWLFITSKANLYGSVISRWYEGALNIVNLRKGSKYNVMISETHEFKNLPSSCSQDSYYQCLVERFASVDFVKSFNVTINGSQCTYSNICLPLSLPLANNDLTMCDNEFDTFCFQDAIDRMQKDQHKYCKKSCNIKEFKMKKKIRLPLKTAVLFLRYFLRCPLEQST